MKKALIAMSGGVDSSLAAKLMKDKGFDCIGCTMKLYHNEDVGIERSRTCCSLDDVEDSRSVAYKLGMPFYVFNFTEAFRDTVIRKFIESYEKGITPNPCIDCNRYMKFDKLFERAKILGCDYIVTGHYARIEEENGNKYMFFPTSSGWEGPAFVYPGYQLAQKTNAFTIKVKMNDVDNNFRMNVTYFDDFGERNYSAETQVQSVTVLQDGWVNVTVTVPSYALRVISFEFKTRTDLRYMVDDIRAVAPVEMQ